MLWNRLLGINSFVFLPIAGIFMLYAAGRAAVTLQWKMLVIAVVVFLILLIVEVVLSILSD